MSPCDGPPHAATLNCERLFPTVLEAQVQGQGTGRLGSQGPSPLPGSHLTTPPRGSQSPCLGRVFSEGTDRLRGGQPSPPHLSLFASQRPPAADTGTVGVRATT